MIEPPELPDKLNILYVFGGEKAQGAEIVIERLMFNNSDKVNAHLILSPGKFAEDLLSVKKPYTISVLDDLKKLNRSSSSKLNYYLKALRNYFAVSYKVFRYLQGNHINVIHANTMVVASYLIPLNLYSRLFTPKMRWYWSDHDLRYFNNLDLFLSKICLKLYDRTLVVSEVVKQKYADRRKVLVLYNGLDTTVFKVDASQRIKFRETYKFKDRDILIGLAASINPDKGQLPLINAFKTLSEVNPNICLILAGGFASDSPQYSEDVKVAIENNPKVVFLGYVDDMIGFYNGCDIIVNNSSGFRSEPLGTTIYEAMACEKIVLASKTGGSPEIITDGKDGFIFDNEQQSAIEDKLRFVFDNYDALDNVRLAARRKVIEKFNISIMTDNYNKIINDDMITKKD